jgi:hypothetical protein
MAARQAHLRRAAGLRRAERVADGVRILSGQEPETAASLTFVLRINGQPGHERDEAFGIVDISVNADSIDLVLFAPAATVT